MGVLVTFIKLSFPHCVLMCYVFTHPNITQPNTLNSGAEFDAAPMPLRGGSDASSGGSIILALPVLAL